MLKPIQIGKNTISTDNSPFVIAEISANHNGSIKNAKKLIYTAKKNGADIVKLQTYEPRNMTINFYKKDLFNLCSLSIACVSSVRSAH